MEQFLTVYGGAMIAGFFVTLVLVAAVLFLYRWYQPNVKSTHHTPTKVSRFGGAALIAGFLLVLVFSAIPSFPTSWWIFVGVLLVIVIVGLLDDVHPLHWGYQLSAQLGLLAILYIGGVRIEALTTLEGGIIDLTRGGLLVGAFFLFSLWGVLVFNTVNWLDGVDGLCASVMAVTYGTLFILALSPAVYQPAIAILLAIALGVTSAFLVYNYPPARIIGGTSGSLFFGAVVIFVSVVAGTKIATTLLVLALPITDTFFVLVKRFLQKRSFFAPDHGHLHHILQREGWSNRSIVLLYVTLTVSIGSVALVTEMLGKFTALVLVFGLLTAVLTFFHFPNLGSRKWRIRGMVGLGLVLVVFLACQLALRNTQNAFIGGHWYALRVAATAQERATGLSGSKPLCLHCGMLFVFPESQEVQFWMKDMEYSIDVLWLENDRVVAKNENLPFPSLETFGPGQTITKVIELPAGGARDIPIGAKIIFW